MGELLTKININLTIDLIGYQMVKKRKAGHFSFVLKSAIKPRPAALTDTKIKLLVTKPMKVYYAWYAIPYIEFRPIAQC
jgi:hypothetical protein